MLPLMSGPVYGLPSRLRSTTTGVAAHIDKVPDATVTMSASGARGEHETVVELLLDHLVGGGMQLPSTCMNYVTEDAPGSVGADVASQTVVPLHQEAA